MGVLDKKDIKNVYCCSTEGTGFGNTALNQDKVNIKTELTCYSLNVYSWSYACFKEEEKKNVTTYAISETTLIYIIITLWQGNSQTSFNHNHPPSSLWQAQHQQQGVFLIDNFINWRKQFKAVLRGCILKLKINEWIDLLVPFLSSLCYSPPHHPFHICWSQTCSAVNLC